MLKIAIPKGSLEEGTFRLFDQAGLTIKRKSERDYNLTIDDPRIEETFMLRPPEIAEYVSEGQFDLGITGLDWIRETEVNVKEVADLQFSRGGWRKVKIVLATNNDNPITDVKDISVASKVATEYPRITRNYFKKLGKGKISIRISYGATEIKVPRLAQYLVDVTETGQTLIANNKKILATIMESSTKLIANVDSWNNPAKKSAILEVAGLLMGVIEARDKALIKMNVAECNLNSLVGYLPALRSATVTPLFPKKGIEELWFAVETVVRRSELNIIIPEIRKLGARDILEVNVSKMIS